MGVIKTIIDGVLGIAMIAGIVVLAYWGGALAHTIRAGLPL